MQQLPTQVEQTNMNSSLEQVKMTMNENVNVQQSQEKSAKVISSSVSEIETNASLSEMSFQTKKVNKRASKGVVDNIANFEKSEQNLQSNISQSDREEDPTQCIPRNHKFIEEAIQTIPETEEENLIQINKHLYLCPPNALSLDYCINPWMKLDSPFSKEVALKQWNELFNLYKKLCGPNKVTRVEPKEKLTELCFFGDSIFAIGNQCIFSRFATTERFDETDYVMDFALQKMKLKGTMLPQEMFFEGSGETMMWNGKILVGYGKRNSSPEIADFLSETFGIEAIGLELIDQRFYHLDTALFPINKDLIAVYPPAFSEVAWRKIQNLGCELIELTYEDALAFACNSVSLDGKTLVVHYEAERFVQELRKRGFTVHTVDISEFIKFGGGLKCLTFQHYNEGSQI